MKRKKTPRHLWIIESVVPFVEPTTLGPVESGVAAAYTIKSTEQSNVARYVVQQHWPCRNDPTLLDGKHKWNPRIIVTILIANETIQHGPP